MTFFSPRWYGSLKPCTNKYPTWRMKCPTAISTIILIMNNLQYARFICLTFPFIQVCFCSFFNFVFPLTNKLNLVEFVKIHASLFYPTLFSSNLFWCCICIVIFIDKIIHSSVVHLKQQVITQPPIGTMLHFIAVFFLSKYKSRWRGSQIRSMPTSSLWSA